MVICNQVGRQSCIWLDGWIEGCSYCLVSLLPYSIFLLNQKLYCITPSKIEKAEGHNLIGETYQGYVNGLLINAYINVVFDYSFH